MTSEGRSSTASTVSGIYRNILLSPAPICMFYFSHPFGISTPVTETSRASDTITKNTNSYCVISNRRNNYNENTNNYSVTSNNNNNNNSNKRKLQRELYTEHISTDDNHTLAYVPWPRDTWRREYDLPPLVQLLAMQNDNNVPDLETILRTIQQVWNTPTISRSLHQSRTCNITTTDFQNSTSTLFESSDYNYSNTDMMGSGSNTMIGPGLLRRRYSVPEIIMRKHSLSQQKSYEESIAITEPTPRLSSISSNTNDNNNTMDSKNNTDDNNNNNNSNVEPTQNKRIRPPFTSTGSDSNLSSSRGSGGYTCGNNNGGEESMRRQLLRRIWSKEFKRLDTARSGSWSPPMRRSQRRLQIEQPIDKCEKCSKLDGNNSKQNLINNNTNSAISKRLRLHSTPTYSIIDTSSCNNIKCKNSNNIDNDDILNNNATTTTTTTASSEVNTGSINSSKTTSTIISSISKTNSHEIIESDSSHLSDYSEHNDLNNNNNNISKLHKNVLIYMSSNSKSSSIDTIKQDDVVESTINVDSNNNNKETPSDDNNNNIDNINNGNKYNENVHESIENGVKYMLLPNNTESICSRLDENENRNDLSYNKNSIEHINNNNNNNNNENTPAPPSQPHSPERIATTTTITTDDAIDDNDVEDSSNIDKYISNILIDNLNSSIIIDNNNDDGNEKQINEQDIEIKSLSSSSSPPPPLLKSNDTNIVSSHIDDIINSKTNTVNRQEPFMVSSVYLSPQRLKQLTNNKPSTLILTATVPTIPSNEMNNFKTDENTTNEIYFPQYSMESTGDQSIYSTQCSPLNDNDDDDDNDDHDNKKTTNINVIHVTGGSTYPNEKIIKPIFITRLTTVPRTESMEVQPSSGSMEDTDTTEMNGALKSMMPDDDQQTPLDVNILTTDDIGKIKETDDVDDDNVSLVDSLDDPISSQIIEDHEQNPSTVDEDNDKKYNNFEIKSQTFFVPIVDNPNNDNADDNNNKLNQYQPIANKMPDKIREKLERRQQNLDNKKLWEQRRRQKKIQQIMKRGMEMNERKSITIIPNNNNNNTNSKNRKLATTASKSTTTMYPKKSTKQIGINQNSKKILRSEIGMLETYIIDAKGNMKFKISTSATASSSTAAKQYPSSNIDNNNNNNEICKRPETKCNKIQNVLPPTNKNHSISMNKRSHPQKAIIDNKNQDNQQYVQLQQQQDLITPDDIECGPRRMYQKTEILDGEKRIEILEIVECIDTASTVNNIRNNNDNNIDNDNDNDNNEDDIRNNNNTNNNNNMNNDNTNSPDELSTIQHSNYNKFSIINRKSKIPIPVCKSVVKCTSDNDGNNNNDSSNSSSNNSNSNSNSSSTITTPTASVDQMIADLLIEALNNPNELNIELINKSITTTTTTTTATTKRDLDKNTKRSIKSRKTVPTITTSKSTVTPTTLNLPSASAAASTRRSANGTKYQRIFDVIPEEKSSLSIDSSNEDTALSAKGLLSSVATATTVTSTPPPPPKRKTVIDKNGNREEILPTKEIYKDIKRQNSVPSRGKAAIESDTTEPEAWLGFFKRHDGGSSLDSTNEDDNEKLTNNKNDNYMDLSNDPNNNNNNEKSLTTTNNKNDNFLTPLTMTTTSSLNSVTMTNNDDSSLKFITTPTISSNDIIISSSGSDNILTIIENTFNEQQLKLLENSKSIDKNSINMKDIFNDNNYNINNNNNHNNNNKIDDIVKNEFLNNFKNNNNQQQNNIKLIKTMNENAWQVNNIENYTNTTSNLEIIGLAATINTPIEIISNDIDSKTYAIVADDENLRKSWKKHTTTTGVATDNQINIRERCADCCYCNPNLHKNKSANTKKNCNYCKGQQQQQQQEQQQRLHLNRDNDNEDNINNNSNNNKNFNDNIKSQKKTESTNTTTNNNNNSDKTNDSYYESMTKSDHTHIRTKSRDSDTISLKCTKTNQRIRRFVPEDTLNGNTQKDQFFTMHKKDKSDNKNKSKQNNYANRNPNNINNNINNNYITKQTKTFAKNKQSTKSYVRLPSPYTHRTAGLSSQSYDSTVSSCSSSSSSSPSSGHRNRKIIMIPSTVESHWKNNYNHYRGDQQQTTNVEEITTEAAAATKTAAVLTTTTTTTKESTTSAVPAVSILESPQPLPTTTSRSSRYQQFYQTNNNNMNNKDNNNDVTRTIGTTTKNGKSATAISGWSLTLAGTYRDDMAPDVEMRLSFPTKTGRNINTNDKNNNNNNDNDDDDDDDDDDDNINNNNINNSKRMTFPAKNRKNDENDNVNNIYTENFRHENNINKQYNNNHHTKNQQNSLNSYTNHPHHYQHQQALPPPLTLNPKRTLSRTLPDRQQISRRYNLPDVSSPSREIARHTAKKAIKRSEYSLAVASATRTISNFTQGKRAMSFQALNTNAYRFDHNQHNVSRVRGQRDHSVDLGNLSSRRMSFDSQQTPTEIMALSVLGNAIAPEQKPRVPTMSEKDVTRRHNPCFTRNRAFFS